MKSFSFGGTNPFLSATNITAASQQGLGLGNSSAKRPSLPVIVLTKADQAAPDSNPSSSNCGHYFSEPDYEPESNSFDKKRKNQHDLEMSSFEKLLFSDKENQCLSSKRKFGKNPRPDTFFLESPFLVMNKEEVLHPANHLRSPFKVHSPLRFDSIATSSPSSSSLQQQGAGLENPFLIPLSTPCLGLVEPNSKMNIHRPSIILEKLLSEPDISTSHCQDDDSIEGLVNMILSDLKSDLPEEPPVDPLPTDEENANEDRFPHSKSPNSLLLEWINEDALLS